MNLAKLRKSVDTIDAELVRLLNRRARIILDIGKLKARKQTSIYVPEREKSVYANIAKHNKGPLPEKALGAIFREIMSGSFQLERPLRVAYLGPEFTFTHLASMKKFGASVTYVPCETITDVFAEVAKARADYGVVPIENSIEGAVNHTLDMFADADLKICSEVYLEIVHNLLSLEKEKRAIRRVYSKAEVFAQCRAWLETNLYGVELIEASSTARAAAIAASEKRSACIANEHAGKKNRLRVLARGIEDSTHNVTRFLVVGTQEARPTGDGKTSIMISAKDRAGALHELIAPFKRHGINLTKIESRPSKIRAWEYYFFIDLEGHADDPHVRKALTEVEKASSYLKILGSYPIAESV